MSQGDLAFWLCWNNSGGGVEHPLDFDGDGDVDGDDLAVFQECLQNAGSVELLEAAGLEAAMNAANQGTQESTMGGSAASYSDVPGLVLYHFRARSDLPGWGRFMQKDPLGYVYGMNLYEYVRANPVKFLDPNGAGPIFPGGSPLMPTGCKTRTVSSTPWEMFEQYWVTAWGPVEPSPLIPFWPFPIEIHHPVNVNSPIGVRCHCRWRRRVTKEKKCKCPPLTLRWEQWDGTKTSGVTAYDPVGGVVCKCSTP